MELRRIGYFREFYKDSSHLPSIRDAVRAVPHPDVAHILAYLRAGIGLSGYGGYPFDVLSTERKTTPPPHH